jgi:hypothetical protein
MPLTVQEVFDDASCSDHPLQFAASILDKAETILALGHCGCKDLNEAYDTCGSYCDSDSFAVARLADGRFVGVEEASDSTGHGCQCSGSAVIAETLAEVVAWLSTENREAFIARKGGA